MEALAKLAAELAERRELAVALDALGYHSQFQVGCEVEDQPHERPIRSTVLEAFHERHPDLEPVDWK